MNRKNWEKFCDFYFNFPPFKSLFWINISYFSINQPNEWIYWGEKWKKICSIFFHFFPWAQMTLIWIFLVKLRMDIKMANPWLHRNHQYRSKYYVLLSFLAYWKSPFRVRTPCMRDVNFLCRVLLHISAILENIYYWLYIAKILSAAKLFQNRVFHNRVFSVTIFEKKKKKIWFCTHIHHNQS